MDFAACYDAYHALVRWRCLRLYGDVSDADDAAQEVWLKVWRAWSQAPADGEELRRWLFVLMRNQWHDDWRKRERRPRVIGPPDARAAGSSDVERAGVERAEVARVVGIIEGFGEHWREVLRGYAVGYTETEMAACIGVSRGTICSRGHRARAELRKRVA